MGIRSRDPSRGLHYFTIFWSIRYKVAARPLVPEARRGALLTPAEMIVEAGADHVIVHRNVVRRQAAIESAIELAEVNMKIFSLGRPVTRQRDFNAAADRPAGIRGARSGKAGCGCTDVAQRQSAAEVRHDAAKGVTGAPAHGREPAVTDAAARAERGAAGAFQVRPIDIAFHAKHRIAELPIVSGRAPKLRAREIY